MASGPQLDGDGGGGGGATEEDDRQRDRDRDRNRTSTDDTTARPDSGSGGTGAASGPSAGGGTDEQTAPGPGGDEGPQPSSGDPSTSVDDSPPPGGDRTLPEGAPESVPARDPTDADPTATTNVSRGELLATDEVQSYLDETGLRPDEIMFRAEEGVGTGGSIRFSIEPTEEGEERVVDEQRQAVRSDAPERIEADLEGRTLTPQGERLVPDFLRAAVAPDVDITAADIQLTEAGFTLTPEATARVDEAFAGAVGPPAGRVSGAAAASSALGSQQADARQANAARLSGFAAATSAQANTDPTENLDRAIEDAKQLLGVNVAEFGDRPPSPGPGAAPRERVGTTRVSLGNIIDGPITLPVFAEREPSPGPGAAAREQVGATEILQGPLAQDIGEPRDLGNLIGGLEVPRGERPVTPGPGSAPRSRDETETLDETLERLVESSLEFGELGELPVGDREIVPGPRAGARERVPAEQAPEDQQTAANVLGILASLPPSVATGAAKLGVDAADFGAETVGALSPELGPRETAPGPRAGARATVAGPDFARVGELFGGAAQVGVNAGALLGQQFVSNPVETGVIAGTTLVGTAGIFRAASAAGPRTSLATRFAIQPGEEIAGIGGYSATRVVSPGLAERAFPGTGRLRREPLFLSEEFALRQIRRANRRIRARAAEVDVPGGGRANVESLFGELRTEARIQSGFDAREPRLLVEGPFLAEDPATVGRGGPSIQVLDAEADARTDLELQDTETDPDAGEPGDGGAGSGGGFDVALEQRTGTGQAELVRLRVPREIESEVAELEGRARDAEAFARRRRLETSFTGEALLAETPFMVADARTVSYDAGELLDPTEVGELETPGEGDLELEIPGEVNLEDEDTEIRPRELLLEREGGELEQEQEQEPEPEPRELETDPFDLRGELDTSDDPGPLGLIDRTIHFEFFDPLESIGAGPSAGGNPLLDIWGGGPGHGPGAGDRRPADTLLERTARFGFGPAAEPAREPTGRGPTPGDILGLAGLGGGSAAADSSPEPAGADPFGFFGGGGSSSPSSSEPSIPAAPWMAPAGAAGVDATPGVGADIMALLEGDTGGGRRGSSPLELIGF